MDPRHLQRIKTVQNLFAYSYANKEDRLPFPDERTAQIIAHLKEIDKLIAAGAPRYPLKNIAKADLAILRLSIYDLLVAKDVPQKVVIDEAVILAKELSGDRSYAFINAVLGKILPQTVKSKKSPKNKGKKDEKLSAS